jgi:hypothetical protein
MSYEEEDTCHRKVGGFCNSGASAVGDEQNGEQGKGGCGEGGVAHQCGNVRQEGWKPWPDQHVRARAQNAHKNLVEPSVEGGQVHEAVPVVLPHQLPGDSSHCCKDSHGPPPCFVQREDDA